MKTEPSQEKAYSFTEWLASYPQPSTANLYRLGAKSFLTCIYKSDEDPEVLAARYVKESKSGKRNHFRDLVTYIGASSHRPPTTLKAYMNGIRAFLLLCCDIDFNTKERRLLKARMPKGQMARTHKDDLDREKLRAILSHCDVKMKALVLVLLSSGIRVGEALQLKMSDIPPNTFPQVVNVRGETAKEGDSYASFMSSESKEACNEWFKVREDYIKGSAYRIANLRDRKFRPWKKTLIAPPSEDNVFPFTYDVANKQFTKALKRAKLLSRDGSTGHKSIAVHGLRRYFLSQIKTKIPSEVAEAMAGHLTGLRAAYTNYSQKQLAEFYLKGEPALLVNQDTTKLDQLTEQVDKKDRQVTDLIAYNIQLQGDIRRLEDRMTRWEAFSQKFMSATNDELTEVVTKVVQSRAAKAGNLGPD